MLQLQLKTRKYTIHYNTIYQVVFIILEIDMTKKGKGYKRLPALNMWLITSIKSEKSKTCKNDLIIYTIIYSSTPTSLSDICISYL